MRHLDVSACDVTPPHLACPVESKVQEVEGLDIPEEKEKHHHGY